MTVAPRFAACVAIVRLLPPQPAGAYSVLAHEWNVDAVWQSHNPHNNH